MFTRARFLLLLAIVGFAVPNAMVVAFAIDHGVDLARYFGDWFDTLPAAQLTADLAICCVAFIGWTSWDGARSGVERWWITIPAAGLVGLCFAIPLYLYLRERRIAGPAEPA